MDLYQIFSKRASSSGHLPQQFQGACTADFQRTRKSMAIHPVDRPGSRSAWAFISTSRILCSSFISPINNLSASPGLLPDAAPDEYALTNWHTAAYQYCITSSTFKLPFFRNMFEQIKTWVLPQKLQISWMYTCLITQQHYIWTHPGEREYTFQYKYDLCLEWQVLKKRVQTCMSLKYQAWAKLPLEKVPGPGNTSTWTDTLPFTAHITKIW